MEGMMSIIETFIQSNRLGGKGDDMTGFCYVNSEANNLSCYIRLDYSQKVGNIYEVGFFGFEC